MTTDPSTNLVIISGPSGAGKSTVVRKLLQECKLPLALSVSATTRPPRDGEMDGQDYHFLSDEQFAKLREEGQLVESKEVFGQGYWYGTLRSELTSGLNGGKWVVLEIDVEGMRTVVNEFPNAVTIFIHPGSMEELEQRLRRRATESESSIQRRLQVAQRELSVKSEYRFEVVNDDVERAVSEICGILESR